MEKFLSLYYLWILGAFTIVLVLWALFLQKVSAKHQKKAELDAEDIVKEIIKACREENRQRFVNDDTIEFIYLILGDGTSHLIWAKVCITKKSASVIICHAPGLSDLLMFFAEAITAEFKKQKGWSASLYESSVQPTDGETGVEIIG